MKTYIKVLGLLFPLGLILKPVFAQAIYDANGQYKGYSQTSPSGVTNIYNAQGQNVQSFQTDNGQTNFYSPQGQYKGSSTTPIQTTPNTTINTPRQAPQVPTVKGW